MPFLCSRSPVCLYHSKLEQFSIAMEHGEHHRRLSRCLALIVQQGVQFIVKNRVDSAISLVNEHEVGLYPQ